MSEIKPRQFWLASHHSDQDNLVFIFDTPDVGIHVIEAAPVLAQMDELMKALEFYKTGFEKQLTSSMMGHYTPALVDRGANAEQALTAHKAWRESLEN